MDRVRIDAMVNGYRECAARAEHLRVRIAEYSALMGDIKANAAYYSTSTTGSYSGMPSGKGGVPESKVERIAITLAEGRLPGELGQVEREIYEMREELRELETRMRYVDAWVKGVPPRERYVLQSHLIMGQCWRDVIEGFNAAYGVTYSVNGMKALLKRAMERIYRIAG